MFLQYYWLSMIYLCLSWLSVHWILPERELKGEVYNFVTHLRIWNWHILALCWYRYFLFQPFEEISYCTWSVQVFIWCILHWTMLLLAAQLPGCVMPAGRLTLFLLELYLYFINWLSVFFIYQLFYQLLYQHPTTRMFLFLGMNKHCSHNKGIVPQ